MDPRESSLLRESLERSSLGVRFASIFGSYRRGDADRLSDVDVFIVCEDEAEKPAIAGGLTRLSSRIGREIHTVVFTLRDFEERVRNHDYLIASILDDSSFVFGDEEAFFGGKRRIFTRPLHADSTRFNVRMGAKMLDRASGRLRDVLFNEPFIHNLELGNVRDNVLLPFLRDYHLGLGYLAASERMKRLNKAISLRQLLASHDSSLLRHLILTEKNIMRKATVNLTDLKNLLNYSDLLPIASELTSRLKIL